jgi:hypothetical protein
VGLKWPGHEADHLPPSSAQVLNGWNCSSTAAPSHMPQTIYLHFNHTLRFPSQDVLLRNSNLCTRLTLFQVVSVCACGWLQST